MSKENITENTTKIKKEVSNKEAKKEVVKETVKETVKEVKKEAKKEDTNKSDEIQSYVKVENESKKTNKPKKPQNTQKAVKKQDIMDKLSYTIDKLTSKLPEDIKGSAVGVAKIVVPILACIIVVVAIISYVGARKGNGNSAADTQTEANSTIVLSNDPLEENAHEDVNSLMRSFYEALSSGDMDTVRELRDYNDDTEILQYEKKSEFIEAYDNVTCYTKPGLDDSSYFVYVTYDVKVEGIDTKAPGLNAFFVYTNDDGKLVIDGNMEDDVTAAFKLVTSQDDVVDLYNRVDVNYNEAIASDEALDGFMAELPMQIKTSVGEALAQLEVQNDQTQEDNGESGDGAETSSQSDEVTENQTVDQQVRTTDTVNVRSSDSETADKIGKAAAGTELKRTQINANGWSKVVYEGSEAYIKSDYLELVSDTTTADTATADNTTTADTTTQTQTTQASGKITALTNVNVRESADQNSTKLGTAVAGNSYDLLGTEGEWYKFSFNGGTGYGKAEFFEKQ